MASKTLINQLHREAKISMAPYEITCVEQRNSVNSAYYEADSLYGKVKIGIHDDWISLRVEKHAELRRENIEWCSEVNPHTGKWNIHVSDPRGNVNKDCLNTLITYFQARLRFLGVPVRDVCLIMKNDNGNWGVMNGGGWMRGSYDSAAEAKLDLIKTFAIAPAKIEVIR